MAQCATTALAGAVPRPCVRGARGRFGGFGPVPGVVSLPFPPSRPACPALRVAGRPVRVSLTLARWYAIPCGLCLPRARSGCPSRSPRVPFACVCARAPAASAPPPPWMVWLAHLARSRHWALVGPFHVVRAPPRVLPRSPALSGVLEGGRSGPGSPLPGFELCAPCGAGPWRSCAGGRVGVGGAARAPCPPFVRLGGPVGRGVALPLSVPLPSLGVATKHRPHSWRPCEPALLAVGVAEGRPWGGAFDCCEGRLTSGAPPPPTARPLGGLLGSTTHVLWARACGCGGPTLSPWPACPVGAACRGGGGGPSPGGWPATVARGVWCQALSLPLPPASGAGGRGPATRVSRVRSLRVRGPSTGPTACALAGRLCLQWGWRKGVPGGGVFHRCEGRLRSGAPPPPTARPLGGPLGSANHVLWARACGCGGPTLSPWPACPVGAACCGVGGGPSPGGVACHCCEGRLVSGADPPPTVRPLGRAAGVLRPVCSGCGRCGPGDPAPVPQRAPLRAGVARCGGGGRASPGGCLPPL